MTTQHDTEREERKRRGDKAREALARKGVSISSWAASNGFSTQMVFQVLKGDRKCIRGESHKIAVALGIKQGEIVSDPGKALSRAA
jgi:gp16 family phage-associated protein